MSTYTNTYTSVQYTSSLLKGRQMRRCQGNSKPDIASATANETLPRQRQTKLALSGTHSSILLFCTQMNECEHCSAQQQHSTDMHIYIYTHTHVGHTFELSGEFSREVRQAGEVEDPQVLSFAAHSVRGGGETSPRAGVPADDSDTHVRKRRALHTLATQFGFPTYT